MIAIKKSREMGWCLWLDGRLVDTGRRRKEMQHGAARLRRIHRRGYATNSSDYYDSVARLGAAKETSQ